MGCVADRPPATFHVVLLGFVVGLGACAESPSLPPGSPLAPDGPAYKVYPIAGVTGTACKTNYIDDGNGGCIYAPQPDDTWGGTGGGTTPTSPTGETGATGTGTAPEKEEKPPCNTGLAVLDDPEVQAAFAVLWGKSGFSKPQSERREQGGWIIKDTDGSFSVQEFPLEWARTPCSISIPGGTIPPQGTIAMIHTHPFRTGELLTTCQRQQLPDGTFAATNYRNDSSMDDDAVLRDLQARTGAGLIGIIIDNEKIVAYEGAGAPPFLKDRCGY